MVQNNVEHVQYSLNASRRKREWAHFLENFCLRNLSSSEFFYPKIEVDTYVKMYH